MSKLLLSGALAVLIGVGANAQPRGDADRLREEIKRLEQNLDSTRAQLKRAEEALRNAAEAKRNPMPPAKESNRGPDSKGPKGPGFGPMGPGFKGPMAPRSQEDMAKLRKEIEERMQFFRKSDDKKEPRPEGSAEEKKGPPMRGGNLEDRNFEELRKMVEQMRKELTNRMGEGDRSRDRGPSTDRRPGGPGRGFGMFGPGGPGRGGFGMSGRGGPPSFSPGRSSERSPRMPSVEARIDSLIKQLEALKRDLSNKK